MIMMNALCIVSAVLYVMSPSNAMHTYVTSRIYQPADKFINNLSSSVCDMYE